MKVLVLGSIDHDGERSERKSFQSVCRDIGSTLVSKGHTLIVCSSGSDTADLHAVEGANLVRGPHQVIVYTTSWLAVTGEQIVPFSEVEGALTNLNFRRKQHDGPLVAVHAAAIRAADVVLVIGGSERTENAGYMAHALGVPILGIPHFGGAGETIWDDYRPRIDEIAMDTIHARRTEELGLSVEVVLQKIHMANISQSNSRISILLVSLLCMGSFAVYCLTFYAAYHLKFDFYLALFLLVAASAFMGASLRPMLNALNDPGFRVEQWRVAVEGATAVVLAFGFMLLYFLGRPLVGGHLGEIADVREFMPAAIGLSAFALAVGFLLEHAAKRLGDRLRRLVDRA